MTVNKLNAGGQSIKIKSNSFNFSFALKIFFNVKARSLTSASSGSIPDKSTVEGIKKRLSISVFRMDSEIFACPANTS